jgi:hypothetical protein
MQKKSRMMAFTLPGLLLTLAACAGPSYDVSADRCDMRKHQALVGQNVGGITLPPSLRKQEVQFGTSPRMANDPSRLTMFVDAKGWIVQVACG